MNARLDPLPVACQMVRGVSFTEYRLTGELPEVLAAIEQLFKGYNPMGYGTMVHTIQHTHADTYTARVSRSNSCE